MEKQAAPKKSLHRQQAALIVLRTLLAGNFIKQGNEEWGYQDGIFGVVRERTDTESGEREEILLKVDMDISAFIAWCDRMSHEALVQMCFNAALKSMKKTRLP